MKEFNAEKTAKEIIDWIRQWFEENGPKANAVIGISGGKDSTIVAKLLVEALGKDRVVGVLMPNGIQADIEDSKKVVELLGIRNYTVNIKAAVDGEYKALEEAGIEISNDTKINTPPRIRMATLYGIAASLENGGRVVNTCNKSEDYVGYSTKGGDSFSDMAPTSDLTVTEILKLGDFLGLPKELVHKTPSDGLCGKTDEDNLGFTYAQLDSYIEWLENNEIGECPIDEDLRKIIDKKHKLNLHKLLLMPKYVQKR